jgi:hypothetical protein
MGLASSTIDPPCAGRRLAGLILFSLALLVLLAARAGAAALPDAALCRAAIALIEPDSHLPAGLLNAIATVESGRFDPRTRITAAWPWAIDVGGAGALFDAAPAAIAAVRSAQAAGIQSIDVGCMQINLLYHPHAFASLEEAFDPVANVRYAAGFLAALHAQTGDWGAAVAAYHSATPELGVPYAQRVAAIWPAGARFGLTAPALLAASLSTAAAVDPKHVFTPSFRARLVAAAASRCAQDAAACPAPAAPGSATAVRGGSGLLAQAAAEVDPRHVLTSQFRAKMVAAWLSRHQHAEKAVTTPANPQPDRPGREYARR